MTSLRNINHALPLSCMGPRCARRSYRQTTTVCHAGAHSLSLVGNGYCKCSVNNPPVGVPGSFNLSRGSNRTIRPPIVSTRAAAELPSSLGSARDLWTLLLPEARIIIACALATLISVSAFICVAPALGRVIDIISSPASNVTDVVISVTTLGLVYACSNICLALQVALATSAGETLAARLRAQLFSSLLRKPAAFHDVEQVGNMTTWLGQDIETLQATVSRLLGNRGLRAVLETVGIVAILLWLSWPLAIALLVAAPAVTPLINRATRQIKKASRRAQQRTAEAASNADEIIDNMRIIRVFGAESLQLKRYQSKINASHAANKDVINLQAVLDISGRVRNTLCIMATLCLGAYLTLSGHVTIGVCYSFFVYSFSFAFALSNLSATLGELSKAAGTVSRTLAVLKRAAFDDDNADEGGKESVAHLNLGESQVSRSTDDEIVNGLNGHDIEFRDVSFVHPSGWQLQNVNIDLPKGSTVALIGPSGGGKSTIASLLLGFYKPTSGEILINGQSLQNLDLSWWRRQVGAVEQFPGLISGPIRDVVAYGNPCATDEHIETALKDAQASDFMAKLPITMDASALSGGQKQRIALARAYARHPKVLILDEATSALDSRTEDGVAAVLRKRRADKPLTTLIIAHRLSTIKDADSVVIVADGRVLKQAWGQDKDEIIDNLMAGNRNLQLQDRTLIN